MIVIIEKTEILKDKHGFYIKGSKVDISNYKFVTLENFYIETSDITKKNSLVDICSLLIDKTPGNPNQIIGTNFLEKPTRGIWCNISSSSQKYKIQCKSLEESLFRIRFTLPPEKIVKIRLCLKFE